MKLVLAIVKRRTLQVTARKTMASEEASHPVIEGHCEWREESVSRVQVVVTPFKALKGVWVRVWESVLAALKRGLPFLRN